MGKRRHKVFNKKYKCVSLLVYYLKLQSLKEREHLFQAWKDKYSIYQLRSHFRHLLLINQFIIILQLYIIMYSHDNHHRILTLSIR